MDFRDANLRGILDECQTDLEIVWRESGWEQPGDNAAASLEAPQARLQELLRSVASRLGHISNLVEAVLRLEEMDAADKVETLALEADHRIGNNLQMLVSILNRQAGQARTIDGREAYGHAASQVSAVGALHSFLHGSAKTIAATHGKIDLASYLEGLAYHIAEACSLDYAHRSLTVEAQPLEVTPDHARSIGLIVAELVANAFRHAFGAETAGVVWIRSARRRGDRAYQLYVEDDGRGLPPDFDPRQPRAGFGLRLVLLLADQINARLTVESHPGTRFLLTFPPEPG